MHGEPVTESVASKLFNRPYKVRQVQSDQSSRQYWFSTNYTMVVVGFSSQILTLAVLGTDICSAVQYGPWKIVAVRKLDVV